MGLINWFKEKKLDELSYEIKQLKQEMELINSSIENLKTQVRSIRTLVYRKKYNEDDEAEEPPIDAATMQRRLMGLE